MEKLELYHFHKNGIHDKMWREDNQIVVEDDFNSPTYYRYQNFTTAVEVQDGRMVNYFQLLDYYMFNGLINEDSFKRLMGYAYDISLRACEFKRETILENYRQREVSNLPSRLHCMYLTDEDGIEEWKNKFGNAKLTLYRVEVCGNIFKTSEYLIPLEEATYEVAYDNAYYYWHPNFKKIPKDCNEYLVQGKVKILERIKNI